MKRKLFVLSGITTALTACGSISGALNNNEAVRRLLASAEGANHALIGTRGMAREYRDGDVDAIFRVNGFQPPGDALYARWAASNFEGYRLLVDGAVNRRIALDVNALAALPQQTQITRHDCVEGWSAIGKWQGVRLSDVLDRAGVRDDARYVVFHCMDNDGQGNTYYESLDLHQANHPQALLATRLNDASLDPAHGAPVRLRVPTQLGYKSAKWIGRIELVGSFANIAAGKGGYWEDQGYEWYAGI